MTISSADINIGDSLASVAQLDRVPGFEPGCRGFESLRTRLLPLINIKIANIQKMKSVVLLIAVDRLCSTDGMAKMIQTARGSEKCGILTMPSARLVEESFMNDDLNALFDRIWSMIQQMEQQVVLLAGLAIDHPYALQFNQMLAVALNCQVLLLADQDSIEQHSPLIQGRLQLYARHNRIGLLIQGDLAGLNLPDDLAKYLIGYYEPSQLHFNELAEWINLPSIRRFTPTMLRYYILDTAKRNLKRILLPESEDLRVVQAANLCQQQRVAQCVLLGNREQILTRCARNQIKLVDGLEFVDPEDIREEYVRDYYELRKNKGASMESSRVAVQNASVLAALMLKRGVVDGMVSGACHATADTLLPAFQLIKPSKGEKLISSIFFVCMPDQVLGFADCAVNPNPNSEELAIIAEQSARTARKFGLSPKVAMLSYSTLGSGRGPDVDAVVQAVEILKSRSPELVVDGPLQYDAAILSDVAKLKAPDSAVAGQANVLVFPSLEAGNIGYKIAQRSAGVVCIGPVLQGLDKPVNDLSRGCLVEDIVFTIAVTALQAMTD